MVMDMRLLESYHAVMDARSVTAAARRLGLTQPAVSAHLSRLETEIGFPLFDRVGGRLRPTIEARRFYSEVQNALSTFERLGEVAASIRSGGTESLVVASHPSASVSILPAVVAELLARRPDARIRMIHRTSEEVRAIFEAGVPDIGIAEWPMHIPGGELKRYEVDCVAVLPPGHPAAAHHVVTPEVLAGAPFIGMPGTRLIGHRIQCAFGDAGVSYAPVAESEYFSTICAMVAANCGVSVVDRWSAETFRASGLETRPFEPAIRYEIAVVRRVRPAPSPLVGELLQLLDARLSTPFGMEGLIGMAEPSEVAP